MRALGALLLAVAVLAAADAQASGAPGPIGPVMVDRRAEGGWFVGGGLSALEATLEFEELDFEYETQAIAISAGRQIGRSWSVAVAIGYILGGELEVDDPVRREFDLDEGVLLNVQLVRQWTFGERGEWFIAGELGGGFCTSSSEEELGDEEIGHEEVFGYDVRAGVMAGYEIAKRIRPYVVARGFYGAINWTIDGNAETGTDKYFHQVGAGARIDVPLGFSLGVEGGFLGELRLAVGIATRL